MKTRTKTDLRGRVDASQFQLVYLATLPLFLVGACLARLAGPSGDGREGLSVLGEAKAAARTCGSFSLMG